MACKHLPGTKPVPDRDVEVLSEGVMERGGRGGMGEEEGGDKGRGEVTIKVLPKVLLEATGRNGQAVQA